MDTLPLRAFGSPARYLQGPGALASLATELPRLGERVALVADPTVLALVGPALRATCAQTGQSLLELPFGGEITLAETDRLQALAEPFAPDVVVGAGGGKGIDAGKALAHRLRTRVVTIPTAASTDAPTSKIYVVYDEAHRIVKVGHLPANPDLVVADTQVLAAAPEVLYSAGVGDAIVKRFEVAQCAAAGGLNPYGAQGLQAAQALAQLCYDTLREYAVPALHAVRSKRTDAAFERVVEATVLHSGLAFENGGLSIAHAMTRGLSRVRGTRDALHGHAVAYALLVQLELEGRTPAFIADLRAFYAAVGLPASLRALGLPDPTPAELLTMAEATLETHYVRNFERVLAAQDLVDAIAAAEARAA